MQIMKHFCGLYKIKREFMKNMFRAYHRDQNRKIVYSVCIFFRHHGFYMPQIILKFMMDEEDNERSEWDWLKKK